jgi:DNA-binding transcriptional regulator YiaG
VETRRLAKKTWKETSADWMKDPEFRKEYEEVRAEFKDLDKVLELRTRAGISQAEIAARMGTSQSAVARLETKLGRGELPGMSSLKRYAAALGKTVEIRFI